MNISVKCFRHQISGKRAAPGTAGRFWNKAPPEEATSTSWSWRWEGSAGVDFTAPSTSCCSKLTEKDHSAPTASPPQLRGHSQHRCQRAGCRRQGPTAWTPLLKHTSTEQQFRIQGTEQNHPGNVSKLHAPWTAFWKARLCVLKKLIDD